MRVVIAFDGIGALLGNLAWLSKAKARSVSSENFTGPWGVFRQSGLYRGAPFYEGIDRASAPARWVCFR